MFPPREQETQYLTPAELVQTLEERFGIRLWKYNGKLRWNGPAGVMDGSAKQLLRACAPILLGVLPETVI